MYTLLFFLCFLACAFMASFFSFYTDLGKLGITIFSLHCLGNRVDLLCLRPWWLLFSSFSLTLVSLEPMFESVMVGFPRHLLWASQILLWGQRDKTFSQGLKRDNSKVLWSWYWPFLIGPFLESGVDFPSWWANSKSLWTPFLLLHVSSPIEVPWSLHVEFWISKHHLSLSPFPSFEDFDFHESSGVFSSFFFTSFLEDPLLGYSQVIYTYFETSLLFHGFSGRPYLGLFSGHLHPFWDFFIIFVGFPEEPFLLFRLFLDNLHPFRDLFYFIFIFSPFNHWAPLLILFFLELSPFLCLVRPLFARPSGSSKAHVLLYLLALPRPTSFFISIGWISLVAHFGSQQLMHLIMRILAFCPFCETYLA